MNRCLREPASTLLPRKGMTLVELLVVTGLMAVFLGLVVVGVRGGKGNEKRAADDLASMLMSAQGRALGLPEGAAVILTSSGAACNVAYEAEMRPLIVAEVSGLPPSSPSGSSAQVSVTSLNGEDLQRAYKITLLGFGPDRVAPPTAWLGFVPPATVQFRQNMGQTSRNTVWPNPKGETFNGLLAQYPVKSSVASELEPDVAIDLRFSGVDDDDLVGNGSIAIVFDRVGRLVEVLKNVPEPGASDASGVQFETPLSPLYFLIASRAEISEGKNTLANADATWVAVSPQTGRVIEAANKPQTGMSSTDKRNARENARRGIGIAK